MGIEIERKFLVANDRWKALASPEYYCQGYLNLDQTRTVRIRIVGEKGILTIKGPSEANQRLEFEYEVPLADARQMMELVDGTPIEKNRYKIPLGEHVWEVDEFLGDNLGLVVAEIELRSVEEGFEKPDWIGVEVSDDRRYFNSQLVQNPFRNWSN